MKLSNKFKKYTKVWLAAFLTLAIVLQAFMGLEFRVKAETSDIEYNTELEFSDWESTGTNKHDCDIYSLKDANITSLEGVIVRGKADFSGDTSTFFRVGGTDGFEHGGFRLGTQEGTGKLILWPQLTDEGGSAHVVMGTPEWSTLIYTEITVAMGFSKDTENNWIVEVYINDELRGSFNCGTSEPGLYIANCGVELSDAYKEMKFSDWGNYKTTTDGGISVYTPTDSSVVSLDGVAISGPINFNGVKWKPITIGGQYNTATGGFCVTNMEGSWGIRTNSIGVNGEWASLPNTTTKLTGDIELRLTFDQDVVANNWTVNIYADGEHIAKKIYEGVNPGVYMSIPKEVTVYHMATNKEAGLYNEMLFEDWGRHVATTTNYNMYELTDSTMLSSLDGVAISGTVDFKNTTWKPIAIGGTWDDMDGGFRVANIGANINNGSEETDIDEPVKWGCDTYFDDTASDWIALEEQDDLGEVITSGKLSGPVTLRVTFDKNQETNLWTVRVYADGQYVGMSQDLAADFGLTIAMRKEISVDVPAPTEMEFSDWGIREGKLYGYDIYSLTDKSQITTLDRVAVSGQVDYKGNYAAYFRFGGYRTDAVDNRHVGVCFGMNQSEGASSREWGYTIWPQGVTKLPEGTPDDVIQPQTMLNEARWAELIQKEFGFRVEFYKNIGTGNWSALVCIDEELDGTYKMLGNYNLGQIHPGLYMSSWVKPVGNEIPETIPDGLGGPDFYNPPTEIELGAESLGDSFLTHVEEQEETTVISGSDTDKNYQTSTDYADYGLDYVLDFDVDRELRILQLTDTQIIDSAQCRTEDRLTESGKEESSPEKMYNKMHRYIIATVREAKPDLILMTGDNIYGEFDDDGTSTIALINLMDSLKIPWAPVYGNHDNETDMGIDWQCEQFDKSPYCIWERNLMAEGGNGNYSIGLARNGKLERTIFMVDTNGVASAKDSVYNGTEVRNEYGFTLAQKAWYINSANTVNTVARQKGIINAEETIPSFLGYHVPSEGVYEAAAEAGYNEKVDTSTMTREEKVTAVTTKKEKTKITYEIGEDVVANPGDSGFKMSTGMYEQHYFMYWKGAAYESLEEEIVRAMPTIGTDGVFFGHYHMNSTSVLNPTSGVRWTYGLKTGSYDESPTEYGLGGTLIRLDNASTTFTVEQIRYTEEEINAKYPQIDFVLPEAPENPNYIFWDKDPLKMIGYEVPSSISEIGDGKDGGTSYTITGVKVAGVSYAPAQRIATLGEHFMDYTKIFPCYKYDSASGKLVLDPNVTFTQARNLIIYIRGDANLDDSVCVKDLVHLEYQRLGAQVKGLAGPKSSDVALNGDKAVSNEDVDALIQLLLEDGLISASVGSEPGYDSDDDSNNGADYDGDDVIWQ